MNHDTKRLLLAVLVGVIVGSAVASLASTGSKTALLTALPNPTGAQQFGLEQKAPVASAGVNLSVLVAALVVGVLVATPFFLLARKRNT
jgi:hypothetical protein